MRCASTVVRARCRRKRRRPSGVTAGPGTSASLRARWSGPCIWPKAANCAPSISASRTSWPRPPRLPPPFREAAGLDEEGVSSYVFPRLSTGPFFVCTGNKPESTQACSFSNLHGIIMSNSILPSDVRLPPTLRAVLTGVQRGYPIFLGYVPLGFAYGVLAVQNGIPAVYAVLFSLLVYAGAGQFIAVGMWGAGASVFSIVFTTFVINLRHVLMSAAVAPWFAPFTRLQQTIIGWGLTDEVFAMHSMAMATGETARLPIVYAANFTAHSGWIVGTFIGAVADDYLSDPQRFGLDYALPAMFLALLIPQCKERLYTLAALLAAFLSVVLALCGTGRWNVIIASVITSTIGALLLTRRDSRRAQGKKDEKAPDTGLSDGCRPTQRENA
ncbi:AzlC family ABC transporter permease [uncultured Bilophila sp.]